MKRRQGRNRHRLQRRLAGELLEDRRLMAVASGFATSPAGADPIGAESAIIGVEAVRSADSLALEAASSQSAVQQARIHVEVTVPTGGWRIQIEQVHVVDGELWVLSTLIAPSLNTPVTQAIARVSDELSVAGPDLPIQHFVTGRPLSGPDGPHTFLSSATEFVQLLNQQPDSELLYDRVCPVIPNGERTKLEIDVTVPSSGWAVNIEQVHLVDGELWVLSSLDPPEGAALTVISTVSDQVTVHAPDAPIRHFVTGKNWNWTQENHTYLSSSAEFAELLGRHDDSRQICLREDHEIPGDVDGNGVVTHLDALRIINEMARRISAGDAGNTQSSSETNQYDVNRDGRVSALDALQVINLLANAILLSSVELLPPDDSDSVATVSVSVDPQFPTHGLS